MAEPPVILVLLQGRSTDPLDAVHLLQSHFQQPFVCFFFTQWLRLQERQDKLLKGGTPDTVPLQATGKTEPKAEGKWRVKVTHHFCEWCQQHFKKHTLKNL